MNKPRLGLVAAAIVLAACPLYAQRLIRPAAPAPAPAADKTKVAKPSAGLHIADGTKITNWAQRITDGGAYVWDIQPGGGLSNGSNNAYGGAMYLNVRGNGFAGNTGVMSQSRDEIEVGPWIPDGRLRVHRRIKVYQDRPLARWLDIYENPTATDIQVQVQVQINHNWGIGKIVTSSGNAAFGEADTALATEQQAMMNPAPPVVCHIVCAKNAKVRPTVSAQGNSVIVNWSFTVPANGAVVICQFESQNNSMDEHLKLMASIQPAKLLRDLPGSVRKLIVNFPVGAGFEDIDLERSDKHDVAILANSDPLNGKVLNASFEVEGFYGKLTLPAEQVIGMAAVAKEPEMVRFLLADGQVLCGRAGSQKLQMQLLAGPRLDIPLARLSQWSFAISQSRPYETGGGGGLIMLRSGDRLAFDPKGLSLTLRSLYGPVPLDPASLHRLTMDNLANGVHRATFANGSSLSGLLEPEKIPLPLKLGQKLEISRHMIAEIVFLPETLPPRPMAKIVLSNGDELLGQLTGERLVVRSDYGEVKVDPRSLRNLTFAASSHGRAVLDLWDGSGGLRGDLTMQELSFQVTPGPLIKLPIGNVTSFSSPYPVPPDTMLKGIEELIAKLGSESYQDRQTAMDELIKRGPAVIPLLEPKLEDKDYEVRQRVETIIEKLRGDAKQPAKKVSATIDPWTGNEVWGG